jgi:hypothetical protein
MNLLPMLGIILSFCPRGNGKRFVVRADEKLTAFLGLGVGDMSDQWLFRRAE